MWSEGPCNSSGNALADHLHKDVCDEGWEFLVSQHLKRRGGFVFEFAVASWSGEVGGKGIIGYGA